MWISATGIKEYIKKETSRGSYSAIVFIEDNSVVAEDGVGNVIAKGVAGTDDASVIQSAINSLPTTGGVVKILAGKYSITQKIQISGKGVRVLGEGMGEDSTLYATRLVRTTTFDEPIFEITGDVFRPYIEISDMLLSGYHELTDTSPLIKCATRVEALWFRRLGLHSNGSYGIDLNGSDFVVCESIRGQRLDNYVIHNGAAHTGNHIRNLVCADIKGILRLYGGVGDIISGIQANTFRTPALPLIYLSLMHGGKMEGVNIEGDATEGTTEDAVKVGTCIGFKLCNSKLYRCGAGWTAFPLRLEGAGDGSTVENIHFSETIAARTIAIASAASNWLIKKCYLDKLPTGSTDIVNWENNYGYATESSNTASITGDGLTTSFTVDVLHNLVLDKLVAKVACKKPATYKWYLVDTDADGTYETLRIEITFDTAPANGEVVEVYWEAEVV